MVDEAPQKPSAKDQLIARLRNPLHLRLAVSGGLLGAWFALVMMPITEQIEASAAQIAREKKRVALAFQIEDLRAEASGFLARMPESVDPNDYFRYMLDGFRQLSVKLNKLSPEPTKPLGPFKTLAFRIEAEGQYRDIAALIRWIEDNPRLLRIDSLKIEPKRNSEILSANLVVLGLSN